MPISIFNINDNTWSTVSTSGQVPTRKCHHSSVYIPNDVTINSLDTLTFTWSIPVILNSGGPRLNLWCHTSTLIGAYVFIAFDSYKWVTTYDPINSIQPIPTSPTAPTSPSNTNISVGIIVGGIICVI
ncbi:22828_t:CDS:2, partial [Racocetra persica]